MSENKMDRMRRLVDELNTASEAYYGGRDELLTDYEWDAKFDELRRLEAETGIVLPASPTANVSSQKESGEKEAHEYPALSLAKTKNPAELVKWADGRKIWLSWKLDGLTLVVTYDQGNLTKIVTRGDGHTGTNITHLADALTGILPMVGDTGHMVIRGEAVISYEDFERFRLETNGDYANPRNLASGSLTLKDAGEVKRRNIRWLPFTLVYTDRDLAGWGDRMDYLEQLGFTVVDHEVLDHPDIASVNQAVNRWTLKVTSGQNPYPVDGLVITYDDTVYAEGGSVTGHHATRAGLAFKWQDESVQTALDHIEWSCAASTITPVAVFAPVQLEGTTVQRASLCNISECERLGIGDKGTSIAVIKANKIIPKVIRVLEKKGELTVPSSCPVCNSPTRIAISEAGIAKTLKCTNAECPAKQLKKYTRFVSKGGIDIDGISEATLAKFINEGWIRKYGDIFRLKEHRDEIASLEGFGDKSADNLMTALARSATVVPRRLLFALCIPLVGPDVAKKLLSAYPLDELVDIAKTSEDAAVFADIDGIGPEKSAAFVKWFKDEKNREEYEDLIDQLNIEEEHLSPTGGKCAGLTFVITGDVRHYKNRSELKAYIESQGGKVAGSVSGHTDYLINNDITSGSAKNNTAKKLSVPIISEDDFLAKFAA